MKKHGKNQWAGVTDVELIETALGNWATLNAILADISRRQTAVLLEAELRGANREVIIKRIHQRLARLRTNAELKELLKTKHDGHVPQWVAEELA